MGNGLQKWPLSGWREPLGKLVAGAGVLLGRAGSTPAMLGCTEMSRGTAGRAAGGGRPREQNVARSRHPGPRAAHTGGAGDKYTYPPADWLISPNCHLKVS